MSYETFGVYPPVCFVHEKCCFIEPILDLLSILETEMESYCEIQL